MKKLINNAYANFYLNAAVELGLKFEILNHKVGLARIYNQTTELYLSANVLGINTHLSSSLSVNKVKTSILLRGKKIPVPDYVAFTDFQSAVEFSLEKLRNNKFIVVKPISGSLSYGITVKPASAAQITEAVAEAFAGNSSIMIEEYIPGRHYRITILDDEIIAITERVSAYIMGNGKNTISELINLKNNERGKISLPPICLRKKDFSYIEDQNLRLDDTIPEGEIISLQLGCDLDIGGERIRIDRDTIPKVNLDLFRHAAKTLSLRFSGVDYISPDITIPYTKTHSAINEINSAPDSDVHYRDSYPHDNYAAVRILENVFGPKFKLTKENPNIVPITSYIHQVLQSSDNNPIN